MTAYWSRSMCCVGELVTGSVGRLTYCSVCKEMHRQPDVRLDVHLFLHSFKIGPLCSCVCIDSKPSTPFLFFPQSSICQHWKSSFDRTNPLSLLRFSASTAAACALVRFLSHTVPHAYIPVFPSPRGVVLVLHAYSAYWGHIEGSWTFMLRCAQVFPNRQLKQYRVNSSSHPLIATSCFRA